MAEENADLSLNLENLLSPFSYEPEIPLPKSIPEVPGGMYLSGFISQDCTWGCCFNNAVVKCFPVGRYFEDYHTSFAANSTNTSVAVSSSSYSFTGGHITCATELAIHNPKISSGTRKLLLGISYIGDNNNREVRGAVVLFDPIRCAPMKWIEIPEPVSSITVLSHFEEGGSNRPFFNETMMAMVGIAAVGLRGGSVIIIDLGLDDPNLSIVPSSDGRNVSDLTYRLLYVNPHEYVIATKRHNAVSKRSLIALKFTNEPEDEVVTEAFHYCKPNGESILVLHKNSVAVTCLEYVPATGSLLVGFTCGGFQIWTVNNMELQFSSEPVHVSGESYLHVYDFRFQQPVDDPRNYCYLWVMYGNKSAECTSAHLELHCLVYEWKNYAENFGFVYDGFKQCAKVMTVPLDDVFLPVDSENDDSSMRSSARPIRIWTQPDSDLMYCAWEVGRGGIFYIGAFDLNQWYSNHTAKQIYFNPDSGLCPYWVALPVDIPDVSNFMMDVRIMPKTMMRWENPHNRCDVHLYPASVSFRAVCLTNTGVYAFEHFSIQEKLIRKIIKDGPSLMIQPKSLKQCFVRNGLEPAHPHVYGEHLSQKERDRFFIFSVLLEHKRTPAIIRLADAWLDGSHANVGCTVDLIISWIQHYMIALRGLAEEHWHNILSFADYTLPPETVRFINFSNFAWTALEKLLLALLGPSEEYSVDRQEREQARIALEKFKQYSAAMLMMYKAKLLPEVDGSFIRNLTEHYNKRRQEAKNALNTCVYLDPQYKTLHPLMIDYLMEGLISQEDLREEWNIEEGQPCYPPQHVSYIVKMFMWRDADPKAVARVFMYFLFDLSFFPQNPSTSHNSFEIERKVRGDFKAVMDFAAYEYQEILGFWLLDRGIPDEILIHLKENEKLYQNDELPWCAATVALTAAGYGSDVAELLSRSCPVGLAKLLFSLMTSTTSNYTSLADLMISNNFNANNDLLRQFFEISEQRDHLGEFIRTKSKELPEGVKRSLLAFLNNSNSVKRLSQLLMYYVHTENYDQLQNEFARVRELLRHRNLSEIDRKIWGFQETYISHLLKTTKGSLVNQFLRTQNSSNVRPMQATICIRAVPVQTSSPEETSGRPTNEPRLPPHIRRIKLNETIAQDPLSPLRRYAGRIESAVANTSESNGGKEDVIIARQFSSRKSISRRSFSLSMSRNLVANNANTSFNESVITEDRLNTTTKTCPIDLMNLLKTPAFDHRIDNRQIASLSVLDQTTSQPMNESSVSHHPAPHSIMKETDPTKPKVTKKVELRFENLSMSSEEGDDKNVTVYEDADDVMEDDNNLANTAFEASFSSATDDKSLFGSESAGDVSLPVIEEEEEEGESPRSKTPIREAEPEVYEKEDSPNQSFRRETHSASITPLVTPTKEMSVEAVAADEPTVQPSSSPKVPEPILPDSPTKLRALRSSRSTTPIVEAIAEEGGNVASDESENVKTLPRSTRSSRSRTPIKATENILVDDSKLANTMFEASGTEKSLFGNESVIDKSLTIIEEEEEAESRPYAEAVAEVVIETEEPPNEPMRRETRSSTTTSQDVSMEEVVDESATSSSQPSAEPSAPTTKKRTRSSTRSTTTTPTKEPILRSDENVRSEETESVDLSHRTRRSSRSRTPTRIAESVEALEPPRKSLRRETRASATPSREASTDEVLMDDSSTSSKMSKSSEADTTTSKKRKLKSTRSTTPSREAVVEPDVDVELAESENVKSPPRPTRRSSRSRTPTRVLEVTESEDVSSKSSTRETRSSTTPSREAVVSETVADDDAQSVSSRSSRISESGTKKRKLRATRSTTPSRDTVFAEPDPQENVGEEENVRVPPVADDDTHSVSSRSSRISESGTMKRKLRATRSTTPSRDTVFAEPDPQDNVDDEENVSVPPRRRSSRSRTPSRVFEAETEEPPIKSLRRETRSATTPSREVPADEVALDESSVSSKPPKQSETTPKKRSLRSTRSTTPTREPVADGDDGSEQVKMQSHSQASSKRSARSKTPTRVLEVTETEESPSKSTRSTRSSKTPTREVLADETITEEDTSSTKSSKRRSKRDKPVAAPEPSTSFTFEITQEDMEEEDEEEEVVMPSTSAGKKKPAKPRKTRKRGLKYFQHHQDLSTVIEDSGTEVSDTTSVSLFEATVIPTKVEAEPSKSRRIKGIKMRPVEEEPAEPEDIEPSKPSKRRKATAVVVDFDEEDDDVDNQSVVSSLSTRSTSSRRSTGSTKAKTTRRKRTSKK